MIEERRENLQTERENIPAEASGEDGDEEEEMERNTALSIGGC